MLKSLSIKEIFNGLPMLEFGIEARGHGRKGAHRQDICYYIIQKCVVRCIWSAHYFDNLLPMFKRLYILNFTDL